jgi:hypothetical protein
MSRLALALATLASLSLLSPDALADSTAAQGTGVYTVPPIVIYGRPAKPMVAIVVKIPTVAEAAGAAHDAFHAALLARSEAEAFALEPTAR